MLAYIFLKTMYSGDLLLQIVWSLKISLKTLGSVIFSTQSFSPLGSKWAWFQESLCKVQTEPKVVSAPEGSFQVGSQAHEHPALA